MWPFKKKTSEIVKPSAQIKPHVCDHKFKDFKWYITANYDNYSKMLNYKIIEPYVCIFYGERKDIVLKEFDTYMSTFDEASETIQQIQEKYKEQLEDREVIEDEIHDMILVDREYLEIYSKLHPNN